MADSFSALETILILITKVIVTFPTAKKTVTLCLFDNKLNVLQS